MLTLLNNWEGARVPGEKSIAETHIITDRNTDSITDTDMDRDTDDSDGSNTCVTNV